MLLRAALVIAAAGGTLMASGRARSAGAQSLRGSTASVERMYRQARAEHFSFFETSRGVRRAVDKGLLVPLRTDSTFSLHDVGYPYVRPATLTFVHRLAGQYMDACDEPLVVTSAVRPATRQPGNSVAHSVHPTGMAVDLRKPQKGACLRWLRSTLLELENAGLLEATEEHSPAHFHVAVFATRYTRYVASREKAERQTRLALRPPSAESYTVREGDTLWDIARQHDTTVDAIIEANDLDGNTIRPGQELQIPSGEGSPPLR
jgi:hypothetical protein